MVKYKPKSNEHFAAYIPDMRHDQKQSISRHIFISTEYLPPKRLNERSDRYEKIHSTFMYGFCSYRHIPGIRVRFRYIK